MALLVCNDGDDISLVTTQVDQVHSTQRKASAFSVNCQVIALQCPKGLCEGRNLGQ